MRRRRRSVRRSLSPVKKTSWAYTPEQEKLLMEAFNLNMCPSASRYAELAEEVGLLESVVKQFFSTKRFSLFRRLADSGQQDKILEIRKAYNMRCPQPTRGRAKKVEQAQKPQQALPDRQQYVKQNIEQLPYTVKQQPYCQQQQVPSLKQQPRGESYPYGQEGQQSHYWGNVVSMPYSPTPYHCTSGYHVHGNSSTQSSYPTDPRMASVNNMWASISSAPALNNTTRSTSRLELSMTHSAVSRDNDFRFTQNMPNADYTYPLLPTQNLSPDFTWNHCSGVNQNQVQNCGMDLYQKDRCWDLPTNSITSGNNGMFPPSAISHNFAQFQSTSAVQNFGPTNNLNQPRGIDQGLNTYPTPDPSPNNHDLFLPNNYQLESHQPPAPPPGQSTYTGTNQSAQEHLWWDSPEKLSATKFYSTDGQASNICHSSYESPPTFGKYISWDKQSSDLSPLQVQTPPVDCIQAAPQPSVPPVYGRLHTSPSGHSSSTQPAAYGVRQWMAMGDTFSSTQGELTPDPNRTFANYPNTSGVQGGPGGRVDSEGKGTARAALDWKEEVHQMCFVSQVLEEVNSVLDL